MFAPGFHQCPTRSSIIDLKCCNLRESLYRRRNTFCFTSGQNSQNACPPRSPTTPQKTRSAAFPIPFSLGTLHVLEIKLLPTFPTKRAYAGCHLPSRCGATKIDRITYFARGPNPRLGDGKYRGSSPHNAPAVASIAFWTDSRSE